MGSDGVRGHFSGHRLMIARILSEKSLTVAHKRTEKKN